MQVYKFGGASIATPERMKALMPIILNATKPLTVIVSALGKTTNALEKIVEAAIHNDRILAEALLQSLEADHLEYITSLFDEENKHLVYDKLQPYFVEILWALDDAGIQSDDYLYDQIVCIGELLSTIIFAHFLTVQQCDNQWIDARDIIRTNEYYRNAVIDEPYTQAKVQSIIKPIVESGKICVTQGFIGSSADNNSTTLGREGSDYTASIIAAMLPAQKLTIWKDVPGFLNADPRKYPNTVLLSEISYYEVIELAYYGAQIIHPKTIKPLQNNNIPLYVKCFLDESMEGTVIQKQLEKTKKYPPLIVHKGDQLLIKITTKDFSFITEDNLSNLYQIFALHRVKINMIQNAAISFVACIDSKHFAKNDLIEALALDYEVKINDDCTLLTVRHYEDPSIVEELIKDKKVLLRQRSKRVFQILYKNV